MISLIRPNLSHKAEYAAMIKEFLDAGEKVIPGVMGLKENESFEQFLEKLERYHEGKNIPSHYVPATLYFIINEENIIVGGIDIRHSLNE